MSEFSAKRLISVKITRLPHHEGLSLPAYATPQSAGMDLQAAVDSEVVINPQSVVMIKTGIKIALPAGYEAQIRPRSGLAVKFAITMANCLGTIDEDYRGEIVVPLVNLGKVPYIVNRGDRIAQMIVAPVPKVLWNEVEDFTDHDNTIRQDGGFGSTGI